MESPEATIELAEEAGVGEDSLKVARARLAALGGSSAGYPA